MFASNLTFFITEAFGQLMTSMLSNLLNLLQLVMLLKNAKSGVTYVTIRASSLEFLLADYTTFRKTTKNISDQFNKALSYSFKRVSASHRGGVGGE